MSMSVKGLSSSYTTVFSPKDGADDTKSNQKLDNGRKNDKTDESQKLNEDEKRTVRDLQSRDSEVKAHEAAHQAAGGGMTGAASYTYQQGPDGKMYAIGGEVSIAIKTGRTPEEKIANARQVAAAAMAPANPSPQDYSVATSARVMEMKAQQELAKIELEKINISNNYDNLSKKDENTTLLDISI